MAKFISLGELIFRFFDNYHHIYLVIDCGLLKNKENYFWQLFFQQKKAQYKICCKTKKKIFIITFYCIA